jgi:hypothetical protein
MQQPTPRSSDMAESHGVTDGRSVGRTDNAREKQALTVFIHKNLLAAIHARSDSGAGHIAEKIMFVSLPSPKRQSEESGC